MSGRQRRTRPRRADLSQHFLRAACAARLVQATSIQPADFVVEIGTVFRGGNGTVRRALRPWLSRVQFRRLAADLKFEPNAGTASLMFEQWLGVVRFLARQRQLHRP